MYLLYKFVIFILDPTYLNISHVQVLVVPSCGGYISREQNVSQMRRYTVKLKATTW